MFGGMFGDMFSFEKSAMGDRLDAIKDDPWRMVIGAGDEFGTNLWNTILDKDMDPLVDYWGAPTKEQFANAEAKGINTKPSEQSHDIARVIASLFAGGYGGQAAGLWGGGAGGSGSGGLFGGGGSTSPTWMNYARLGSNAMQSMPQQQQGPQQMQPNPYVPMNTYYR